MNPQKIPPGAGKLSAAGLIAIAILEGYSQAPYYDGAKIPTDGFGNTVNVVMGKSRGVVQDLIRLLSNTSSAEAAVNRCLKRPFNQNQFDAFTSFAFNVGNTAFCHSTVVSEFNAGHEESACAHVLDWTFITREGRKLQCKDAINFKYCGGLVDRRISEKNLCLGNLK